MPLDTTLRVACVAGRGDPAFDRRHPDYRAAVVRYARTRHPAHLDAIPLREGMRPRLYGVAVLTVATRAWVLDAPGEHEQRLRAVIAGVVLVAHPDGRPERPVYDGPALADGSRLAPPSWAQSLGSGAVVDELGSVVLHRASVGDYDEAEGDDPLVPCALPHGLRLAL